ncbi:MAG: Sir2 family NAD-dependent protein deacetylase [Eubacteriales bacterium]|nr:Sir2 family NAD-dependent protein deacetylase [Eubacteriales bacterium]
MSVPYLQSLLQRGSNIVCLLGKAPKAEQNCDFYKESYREKIRERYGRTPEEIVSSTFFHNSPEVFYRFYRNEMLLKRGEPDAVHHVLKQMEEDGKLRGIVTDGYFGLSSLAGCSKVVSLNGSIDRNRCPGCGRVYDSAYVMQSTEVPACSKCGKMLHPGIALQGELPNAAVLTHAKELIMGANLLLVLGTSLNSPLGSLSKYFSGDRICVVNTEENRWDQTADCICTGNIQEILEEAYPSGCSVKG